MKKTQNTLPMQSKKRWLMLLIGCAALMLHPRALAQQQPVTFHGVVLDAKSKEPLIFSNVFVVDSAYGTNTDFDGKFQLSLLAGQHRLAISSIGYRTDTATISIDSGTVVADTFLLQPGKVQVDEVRIISYQTQGVVRLRPRQIHKRPRKRKKLRMAGNIGATVPAASSVHFGDEAYDHPGESGFQQVVENPLSTFSIDVDAASYANVRRFINNGMQPPTDAVRVEEMINYFNYNYPGPTGRDPFAIHTEVSTCPWETEHRLVHIGLKGLKLETSDLAPQNLVFLIDVSGSMSDYNKLALVKRSLRLLVQQLRPQDRLSIVTYASSTQVALRSTVGDKKERILQTIESLEASGSTAGGKGIQLAYQQAEKAFIAKGNNRVILCTDGDFNVGISSDQALVKLIEEKRTNGVFLTVLGYGMGNYKDSKMEKLADKGNGNYAYIDNILEAKKVLVNEMGGTLQTIAKDVKLQVEFNPVKVRSYRLIGYENRLLEKEDFNDDTKDAGELGAGHTVTALYEVVPATTEDAALNNLVDPLRYQDAITTIQAIEGNELFTVKFRYKPIDEEHSQLITNHVHDQQIPLEATTNTYRFSAAVAAFGMLLTNSEHRGNASVRQILKMARSAKGEDFNGYRAEFIRLVETWELMAAR
ncbi:MAG: von Willebrand factor type A domain-containing protein [Bacteroidota bacterium]